MRYLAALLSRSHKLRAPIDQHLARRSLAARKSAFRRRLLFLEQLEDRRVLAAISWDGGGGNLDWNNALNWSGDVLPSSSDDVTIDVAGDVTIVHSSGAADIHSLVSFESIDWSGGSLTVYADSTINANFNNSGTVEVQSGLLSMGGGTHTGDFLIGSGAALSVAGSFETTSDITGAGSLSLYNATQRGIVDIGGNMTLLNATIEGDFVVAGDLIVHGFTTFSGTPAMVGGDATLGGSGNAFLLGTGVINITGLFTWNLIADTQMIGTGKLVAQGGMHLTGTGFGFLRDGWTLENVGQAVFDAGEIRTINGSVFRNLPGASFEVQNDADILHWGGAVSQFDNQGTFLKSTGSATAAVGTDFNNSGTVEVQSGLLSMGGGTHTGDFLIGSGAALSVAGSFETTSDITGAGSLSLYNATQRGIVDIGGNMTLLNATIEGDFVVAGDLIVHGFTTFSGTPAMVGGDATLGGSGNAFLLGTGVINITGLFTWNLIADTQMIGTGKLVAQGGMHLTGTGFGFLRDGWTLENVGQAVFDAGEIRTINGSVFRNLPGASFEVQNDADILHWGGAVSQFDNQGTFLKSTGSATAAVGTDFNNSGTVEVQSGLLSMGGGTHTGDFLIGSGAALSVAGSFETTSDITGAGSLSLYNATQRGIVDIGGNMTLLNATIEGDFVVAGDLIVHGFTTFSGTPAMVGGDATLGGSGNAFLLGTGVINITGLFTWNLIADTQMIGTGKLVAQGGMHLTGTGFGFLRDGWTLENVGQAVFDAGEIRTINGSVFRNLPGASFEVQNDADILHWGGAVSQFDNQGTFLKSTGSATAAVGTDFNNSGTVEVQSGTLAFGSFIQTSGTTRLAGGSISGTLNIQGGSVEGSGSIFGNVNSSGVVSPGFSPGLLDVQGNYTQNSDGAFQAEIGGYTAGTQYDRLNVTGSVMLGGSLDLSVINGFPPVDGDLFTIIDNDSTDIVDGTFNGLPEGTIFSIPSGNQFKISYNGFGTSNDVVLKAINRPPVANAGGPYSIDEGSSLLLNGSGSYDPDPLDTLTYSWDVNGDGVFGDASGVSPTLTWAQLQVLGINDGPRVVSNVRVRVDDGHAHVEDSQETTITITNVAPHDVIIAASVGELVFAVGSSQPFSGSFMDVGTVDTHTAVWTFTHANAAGAIVTETRTGVVTQASGSGTVNNSFSFSEGGVYQVTLTVKDDDNGEKSSLTSLLVVYDPSAGFVTGGGWINSPAGAYTANPVLTGKANFGFSSKYKNGSNVPTGNTEFQFKAADFNFKSNSYEWLVVSGAKARFRGVGTVNGIGGYGFELTAWDGQVNGGGGVDKFRIKIWLGNQGNGVVYDNMLGASDGANPTTALGGGSIVIHKSGQALSASGSVAVGKAGGTLSQESLNQAVDQAITYWQSNGVDADAASSLRQIHVEVADLADAALGIASDTDYVWIDRDAASYGWQIDSLGAPSRSVTGGMDLLSAVAHELGHKLGLEHSHDDSDVMAPTLDAGVRKMVGSFGQPVPFFGASSVLPVSLPLDVTRPSALGTVRLPNEYLEENQARDELFARLDDSLAKPLVQSPTIASKSPYDEPQKPAAEAEDLLAEDLLEVITLDRLAIHG